MAPSACGTPVHCHYAQGHYVNAPSSCSSSPQRSRLTSSTLTTHTQIPRADVPVVGLQHHLSRWIRLHHRQHRRALHFRGSSDRPLRALQIRPRGLFHHQVKPLNDTKERRNLSLHLYRLVPSPPSPPHPRPRATLSLTTNTLACSLQQNSIGHHMSGGDYRC